MKPINLTSLMSLYLPTQKEKKVSLPIKVTTQWTWNCFNFRLEIRGKSLGVSIAKHWKILTMTAGNTSTLVILNTYALTYK